MEQRTSKGIWQHLYQFPLVETEQAIDRKTLVDLLKGHSIINNQEFELTLYNKKEIIHKLSHQHLKTKFWIIEVPKLNGQSISHKEVQQYPVPILIGNFLDNFNF